MSRKACTRKDRVKEAKKELKRILKTKEKSLRGSTCNPTVSRRKYVRPNEKGILYVKRRCSLVGDTNKEKGKKSIKKISEKEREKDKKEQAKRELKIVEDCKRNHLPEMERSKLRKYKLTCFEKLLSIKTCLFSFTFISLFTLTVFLATVFLVFNNWNVTYVAQNEMKLILSLSKERVENWLSKSTKVMDLISSRLGSMEDSLTSWDFMDNTAEGKRDCDRLGLDILQIVRSIGPELTAGILFTSGVVVASDKVNVYTRSYHEPYNTSEGYKGYLSGVSYHENNFTINLINPNGHFNNYDPMNNERLMWYRKEVSYEDYVWVHFLTHREIITSTVTKQFLDFNGVLRGYIAVWFVLDEFNSFLKELGNSHSDIIFVDKDSGLLLASTFEEEVFIMNDKGRKERVRAEDSPNSIISIVGNEILNTFGDYSNVESINFHYYISYSSVRIVSCTSVDVNNFRILIIHVSNYFKLYEFNIIGNAVSIGVAIVITLFFMIFSLICFSVLLRPLLKVISDLKHIEDLNLDSIKLFKNSFMYEVKMLNTRIKFMIRKLSEYKSFIPMGIKDDPNGFDSEESSASSGSLSSGSESGPSCQNPNTNVSLTEFLVNKMGIQLQQVEGIIVIVHFNYSSLERWLESGNGDYFLEFYDGFVKYIFERCRGSVIKVDYNCVVLFYKLPFICIRNAVSIRSWIIEENKRFKKNAMVDDTLGFNILIDYGSFFKGIVGNKQLKLPAVFYNSEFVEKIISRNAKNEIIVTEQAFQHLDQDLFIPIDVIKCVGLNIHRNLNYLLILYKYIDAIEVKNDHFMFEKQVKINEEDIGLNERLGIIEFKKFEWKRAIFFFEKIFDKYIIENKELEKQKNYKEKKDDIQEKIESKVVKKNYEIWKTMKEYREKERLFRANKFLTLSKKFEKGEIKARDYISKLKKFESLFFLK